MSYTYKYQAEMTCAACSNCLTKVLEKNKAKGVGIDSFKVSLDDKTVEVTGSISQEELTALLDKTGIKVTLLQVNPQ